VTNKIYLPVAMAFNEVRVRYARTSLGPWWQTINMLVLSVVLSFVFTKVFKVPSEQFIPFLITGLIFWNFMQAALVESSVCLIHSRSLILNTVNPIWVYPFKVVVKALIQLLHHIVLIPIVIYYFDIDIGPMAVLMFLVGIMVFTSIFMLASNILAILGSRFHDLEQVITNVMQVLFYSTPIIWMPSLLGGRVFFLEYNPFYHLINMLRIPIIGGDVQIWQNSLAISIALLGFLILFNYYVYRRYSKMVSYWV
jgi:lipopolysaccharide transport system permease protein